MDGQLNISCAISVCACMCIWCYVALVRLAEWETFLVGQANTHQSACVCVCVCVSVLIFFPQFRAPRKENTIHRIILLNRQLQAQQQRSLESIQLAFCREPIYANRFATRVTDHKYRSMELPSSNSSPNIARHLELECRRLIFSIEACLRLVCNVWCLCA